VKFLPKHGRGDGCADLSPELRVDGLANDTRPSGRLLQDSVYDLFSIHFSFLAVHMPKR